MDKIDNAKNRRFRNRLRSVFDRFSFNFLHLKASGKIAAVGMAISAISCFFPWFSVGKDFSWTAFHVALGHVAVVKFALLAGLAVTYFSHRTKSEIKSRSGFSMSDAAFSFFAAAVLFALDFSTINVVRGFSLFTKDVSFGDGPALSLVADLFVFAGGLLAYREHKRELFETTFVENRRTNAELLQEYEDIIRKDVPDKKNMSLPV